VVVDEIHIERITVFEAEDKPPVSGNRDAPNPLPLAFQWMKAPAGKQRDVGGLLRGIERREDIGNLLRLLRGKSGSVVRLKKRFSFLL
jgi:hypothetical protein